MKSVRNCRKCWLGWRTKARPSWRMARCSANKTYTANTGTCNIKGWSTGRLPRVVLKVDMNMTSFVPHNLRAEIYIFNLSSYFCCRYSGSSAHRCSCLSTRERPTFYICCCGKLWHFEKISLFFFSPPSLHVSLWVFICRFRTKSLL